MLDRLEGVCVLIIVVGLCAAMLGAGAAVYKHFYVETTPDIFDSMLCGIHTPVGAILVNDELVMCSQKIYRRVK